MKKLHLITRVALILGSLLLITSFKMPIWRIDLTAPQYPEGLTMFIWSDDITGQVEIINGLNHYIGMQHISKEMFPEFTYLNYIFVFVIVAGISVGLLNRRKYLLYYLIFLVLLAITALADFYRWGYDYGHNLDPDAPIVVPGMGYQPPLIGHKKLLNFDAYSFPAKGGVIFISVIGLFMLLYVIELINARKEKKRLASQMKNASIVCLFLISFLFSSCSFDPRKIEIGKEDCNNCMMTIIDGRFACEIVTEKGKILVFDDLKCLYNFAKENQMDLTKQKFIMVNDYSNPEDMKPISNSYYFRSENLQTPMNGNIASFSSQDSMMKYLKGFDGKQVLLHELESLLE